MTDEQRIEIMAACCHSAWYAYSVIGLGEPEETWETAPDWQRESAIAGVKFQDTLLYKMHVMYEEELEDRCESSHIEWMSYKKENGWVYGPEKDEKAKTHPGLIEYEELPLEQKKKNRVFVITYLTMSQLLLFIEPEERAAKEIYSEPEFPIPPKGGTGVLPPMKAGVIQEHEANIKSLWIALNELKKNFMDLQNMFVQVQYKFSMYFLRNQKEI